MWCRNINDTFLEGESGYEEAEKLAAYEDLEEQGLLIRLPCKVGQDVFTIISQRDNFSDQPYKIVSCISFRLELINKIGKTVFLTKEEAEKALERMSEKENENE